MLPQEGVNWYCCWLYIQRLFWQPLFFPTFSLYRQNLSSRYIISDFNNVDQMEVQVPYSFIYRWLLWKCSLLYYVVCFYCWDRSLVFMWHLGTSDFSIICIIVNFNLISWKMPKKKGYSVSNKQGIVVGDKQRCQCTIREFCFAFFCQKTTSMA